MSEPGGTVRGFLFEDLDIRGSVVRLGDAWRAMHAGRGYAAPLRELLGQMAAVGALIGADLKAPGRLTFQLQGHGPISLLVVGCDERLRLRGMARAAADLPVAPLARLFGDGRLAMTLQYDGSEPYQSLVPIEGDSVAAVFEAYLAQSQQQPARLWLSADDEGAAALFLQALPDAGDKDADGWNRVQRLAETLRAGDLALPAELLLTRLFAGEAVRLFDARTVSYHCPRDEDRVRAMLAGLGRDEVEAIVAAHGGVVVRDEICNQEYRFGATIIDELFGAPARTLH